MAARCFRSFATASLRGSDNRSNLAAQLASRNPQPTGAKRRLESQICLRNGTSVSSWTHTGHHCIAARQPAQSFDHLIGSAEQRRWEIEIIVTTHLSLACDRICSLVPNA